MNNKTFKAFLLTENTGKPTPIETPEEFIEKVKIDCSEFLKIKSSLYRGASGISDYMTYDTIRTDRVPMSTSKYQQEVLDDYFEENFGYKYRSGSLFTFSSSEYASHYAGFADQVGKTYQIFPTNGYKLFGSIKVDDLFSIISTYNDKNTLSFVTPFVDTILNIEDTKTYVKLARNKRRNVNEQMQLNNFNEKMLKSLKYFESKNPKDYEDNEIMVRAKGYYAYELYSPVSKYIKAGIR